MIQQQQQQTKQWVLTSVQFNLVLYTNDEKSSLYIKFNNNKFGYLIQIQTETPSMYILDVLKILYNPE